MKTRLQRISKILMVFLSTVFLFSITSAPVYPENEAGTIVCLFYSNSKVIKRDIQISDTLTVYRKKTSGDFYTVGKVVIISYIGNYYIQARIVEGKLEESDIAIKGTFSGIVMSLGGPCR